VFAQAQNREEHFISARAGGVNLASGDVKVRRAGAEDWQTLSVKDDLKNGDVVRVGASGRVEVLLNPGSYFRAGDGTEFEMVNSALDNLQLRLTRGGAVVEATGYGDLDLDFLISTPQTQVRIVRTGVYRVDVSASGETTVAVQKGRALIGKDGYGTIVKDGRVARVGTVGSAEIAKFDKKQRDVLDQWSRDRGKELAKMNAGLANRQTSAMLLSDYASIFSAEFPSSYGLWLWSTRSSCYTFLPFYTSLRSPYGYWYGSWFTPSGYPYYPNAPCNGCTVRPGGTIVNTANPIGGYSPGTTIVRGYPTTPGGGGTATGSTTSQPPQMSSPAPMPAPPPTAVERPTRERTIEPGSRPRDQ
jgi:hypothetical protein